MMLWPGGVRLAMATLGAPRTAAGTALSAANYFVVAVNPVSSRQIRPRGREGGAGDRKVGAGSRKRPPGRVGVAL